MINIPPTYRFTGNKDLAISLKSEALQYYNFVGQQAERGGIGFINRSTTLKDGSVISIITKKERIHGIRTGIITIFGSPSVVNKGKKELYITVMNIDSTLLSTYTDPLVVPYQPLRSRNLYFTAKGDKRSILDKYAGGKYQPSLGRNSNLAIHTTGSWYGINKESVSWTNAFDTSLPIPINRTEVFIDGKFAVIPDLINQDGLCPITMCLANPLDFGITDPNIRYMLITAYYIEQESVLPAGPKINIKIYYVSLDLINLDRIVLLLYSDTRYAAPYVIFSFSGFTTSSKQLGIVSSTISSLPTYSILNFSNTYAIDSTINYTDPAVFSGYIPNSIQADNNEFSIIIYNPASRGLFAGKMTNTNIDFITTGPSFIRSHNPGDNVPTIMYHSLKEIYMIHIVESTGAHTLALKIKGVSTTAVFYGLPLQLLDLNYASTDKLLVVSTTPSNLLRGDTGSQTLVPYSTYFINLITLEVNILPCIDLYNNRRYPIGLITINT